jgi:hypothetical protein
MGQGQSRQEVTVDLGKRNKVQLLIGLHFFIEVQRKKVLQVFEVLELAKQQTVYCWLYHRF